MKETDGALAGVRESGSEREGLRKKRKFLGTRNRGGLTRALNAQTDTVVAQGDIETRCGL